MCIKQNLASDNDDATLEINGSKQLRKTYVSATLERDLLRVY